MWHVDNLRWCMTSKNSKPEKEKRKKKENKIKRSIVVMKKWLFVNCKIDIQCRTHKFASWIENKKNNKIMDEISIFIPDDGE